MMIASILPLVLAGGFIVTVWMGPHQFVVLGIDILVLAVASLGEEVAFRGYPFQRLIEVMGPFLATLVLSTMFGLAHALNPSSSRRSIMITIFAGWLLSAAYLRTRALWLSWGWHFAWNASMGLLFGLPVSGITRFSPVIQSNTIGPLWITGGEYGPEASMVTVVVMLIGLIVLFQITREYACKYGQPATVARGSPVVVDAGRPVLESSHATSPGSAATTPLEIRPDVVNPGNSDPADRNHDSNLEAAANSTRSQEIESGSLPNSAPADQPARLHMPPDGG
jgi:hypothetical protein